MIIPRPGPGGAEDRSGRARRIPLARDEELALAERPFGLELPAQELRDVPRPLHEEAERITLRGPASAAASRWPPKWLVRRMTPLPSRERRVEVLAAARPGTSAPRGDRGRHRAAGHASASGPGCPRGRRLTVATSQSQPSRLPPRPPTASRRPAGARRTGDIRSGRSPRSSARRAATGDMLKTGKIVRSNSLRTFSIRRSMRDSFPWAMSAVTRHRSVVTRRPRPRCLGHVLRQVGHASQVWHIIVIDGNVKMVLDLQEARPPGRASRSPGPRPAATRP